MIIKTKKLIKRKLKVNRNDLAYVNRSCLFALYENTIATWQPYTHRYRQIHLTHLHETHNFQESKNQIKIR